MFSAFSDFTVHRKDSYLANKLHWKSCPRNSLDPSFWDITTTLKLWNIEKCLVPVPRELPLCFRNTSMKNQNLHVIFTLLWPQGITLKVSHHYSIQHFHKSAPFLLLESVVEEYVLVIMIGTRWQIPSRRQRNLQRLLKSIEQRKQTSYTKALLGEGFYASAGGAILISAMRPWAAECDVWHISAEKASKDPGGNVPESESNPGFDFDRNTNTWVCLRL